MPQILIYPSAMQETRVRSLGREDPLGEGNGNLLQHSCLENSSLLVYSPQGRKESDTTEQLTLLLQTGTLYFTSDCSLVR